MERVRGFEVVSSKEGFDVELPRKNNNDSAGYDFITYTDIVIPTIWKCILNIESNVITRRLEFRPEIIPPTLIETGIKEYMPEGEVLQIYNRFSNPEKAGLILVKCVGVVDKNYYNNPNNEGEIILAFYNILPVDITIKRGSRIAQGIFTTFLEADVVK